MAPFRGTFDHTLDAKNRLTMPARYRGALAEGVVLALPVDREPCVGVWRPQDYENFSRRALSGLPALSRRLSEMERFFYGSSHEAELDAAGRVIVPPALIEHAKLDREIVIVGAGERLELWNRALWNRHQSTLLEDVAEITARVDDTA